MTVESERFNATEDNQQELLGDLFHALTQPLTTLRCCLGLSLQKQSQGQPTVRDLEAALQATESLAGWIAGIRDLVEGASRSQANAVANLDQCLHELVEDSRPIAESMGLVLSLISTPAQVKIEISLLRKALFCLFEFAMQSCQPGSKLQITGASDGERTSLIFRGCLMETRPVSASLQARLALAVARRILETDGCGLQLGSNSHDPLLTIHFPCTAKHCISPAPSASRCCA